MSEVREEGDVISQSLESQAISKLVDKTDISSLRKLEYSLEIADQIKDVLRDYKKERGVEVKYIYPKKYTAQWDFFDEYCEVKSSLSKEPHQVYTPETLEEKDWSAIKLAISERIKSYDRALLKESLQEEMDIEENWHEAWAAAGEKWDAEKRKKAEEEIRLAEERKSALLEEFVSRLNTPPIPHQDYLDALEQVNKVTESEPPVSDETKKSARRNPLTSVLNKVFRRKSSGLVQPTVDNSVQNLAGTASVDTVVPPAAPVQPPISDTPSLDKDVDLDLPPFLRRAPVQSDIVKPETKSEETVVISFDGNYAKLNDSLSKTDSGNLALISTADDLIAFAQSIKLPMGAKLESLEQNWIDEKTFTLSGAVKGVKFSVTVKADDASGEVVVANISTKAGRFNPLEGTVKDRLGKIDKLLMEDINKKIIRGWKAKTFRIINKQFVVDVYRAGS